MLFINVSVGFVNAIRNIGPDYDLLIQRSPETKNRTWVEIDEMYDQGVPAWKMRSK
jgi:hypothetical protein